MSTADLIVQAHKQAQSLRGFAYNPKTLEAIITAGILPAGVTLVTMGDQRLVREGDEVVCYREDEVTRRTPLTKELEERLLIAYAVSASKLSTRMGS